MVVVRSLIGLIIGKQCSIYFTKQCHISIAKQCTKWQVISIVAFCVTKQ